jgi:hypothetical protein
MELNYLLLWALRETDTQIEFKDGKKFSDVFTNDDQFMDLTPVIYGLQTDCPLWTDGNMVYAEDHSVEIKSQTDGSEFKLAVKKGDYIEMWREHK